MTSINSFISKYSVSKYAAGITALSLLAVPLIPLTAFAVSDVTPPSVSITAPINGATVSGAVPITASATDLAIPSTDCVITLFGVLYDVTSLQNTHSGGNIFVCGTNMTSTYQGMHGTNVSRMAPYTIPQSGIAKVELWVDGVLNSTDTSSPYAFSWDSTTVANGTHTLVAKAFDLANNQASSATVTVTTNNTVVTPPADTVAPVVSITSPVSTGTKSGTISVVTSATDNVGVTKVELYVDGVLKTSTTTAPYTFSWDTTTVTDGSHTLTAKAYDAAGNVGTSAGVTVTVQNGTVVTPPPAHHDDDDATEVENENEVENEHVSTSTQNHRDEHENQSERQHRSSQTQTPRPLARVEIDD